MLMAVAITLGACSSADDSDTDVRMPEAPNFDENTEAGRRMKQFYDDYGIWCRYDFPAKDLYYAWTSSLDYYDDDVPFYVTPGDPAYVPKVLDFLEDSVINFIPKEIMTDYMGLYLALQGRVYHKAAVENQMSYHDPADYQEYLQGYEEDGYGYLATRHLVMGPVGENFDRTDSKKLRREWTALLFSKALQNMPVDDTFNTNYTTAVSNMWGDFMYDTYIEGHIEWSGWYVSMYTGDHSPYGAGFVAAGPLRSATMWDTRSGDVFIDAGYRVPSQTRAMADYIAFIMYASSEEKATVRAKNELIPANEAAVKEYCKRELNWDIPELNNE